MEKISYAGNRFPPEIIDQAIWDEGIFPQKLTHQLQHGVLVSLGLD